MTRNKMSAAVGDDVVHGRPRAGGDRPVRILGFDQPRRCDGARRRPESRRLGGTSLQRGGARQSPELRTIHHLHAGAHLLVPDPVAHRGRPFSLRMWADARSADGKVHAWMIGAWETRAPMTIWMDGRPHPSKNAPHDQTGFTTGVWNGNELIATTTHIKTGYIRRNGAPSSDEATITTHFRRHGDMLTLALFMDDPVYLTEPYILTRSYNLSTDPVAIGGPPCIVGDEGVESGRVPHYLPGQNPFVDEMTKLYGIPEGSRDGRSGNHVSGVSRQDQR